MAGDDDHARQRRALSHAFSTKALLEQEYIVMKYVETFSQKMQAFARGDGIVDVTDWFAYTTFDVIGELALGEPFGCLHNGKFLYSPLSPTYLIIHRGLPLLGTPHQRIHQGWRYRASHSPCQPDWQPAPTFPPVVYTFSCRREPGTAPGLQQGENSKAHGDTNGQSRLSTLRNEAARKGRPQSR
jgi:hypothetical protein